MTFSLLRKSPVFVRTFCGGSWSFFFGISKQNIFPIRMWMEQGTRSRPPGESEVELFEQPRCEYEFVVGTIRDMSRKPQSSPAA